MDKHNLRFVARICIETSKALSVGTGEKNLTIDRLIAKDLSDLPYIPGTSIKGVLRNLFSQETDEKDQNGIFGFQEKKKDNGTGARFIVSSAHFVGKNRQVFEGLDAPDWSDPFYALYKQLPVRDHVRISDTGSAVSQGKFDEEVVYKGTRFLFELELIGSNADQKHWKQLLDLLYRSDFRIGGGIWKGFGEVKIVEVKERTFDLSDDKDYQDYLYKPMSLNKSIDKLTPFQPSELEEVYIRYDLSLKPDDFFFFGAGEGDDDADSIAVTEDYITWSGDEPQIIRNALLIPGTSVKGAIAHRVAYHFNKEKKVFAESLEKSADLLRNLLKNQFRIPLNFDSSDMQKIKEMLTNYNPAVVDLFGFALASKDKELNESDETIEHRSGNVIISDMYEHSEERKLLNHVAIDRFTGGAVQGALYSEKVAAMDKEGELKLQIKVRIKKDMESGIGASEDYLPYLERALKDIAIGMLPLGGGTMRGHGCFQGIITKNGDVL